MGEFNFCKITNEVFYTKDGTKSILKETNDYKVILLLDFLYYGEDRKKRITFNLEDIITDWELKPDNHKGKINDQFRSLLEYLKERGLILTDIDFNSIKPKEHLRIEVDLKIDNNFFCLPFEVVEKIFNIEEEVNKIILLAYWCYLESRRYKLSNKETEKRGKQATKSETCFLSYKRINEDLGISESTIKKYNDILIEEKLLRIGNLGKIYNEEGKIKCANNLYYTCKNKKDYYNIAPQQINLGLKQQVYYYISKGYTLAEEKYNKIEEEYREKILEQDIEEVEELEEDIEYEEKLKEKSRSTIEIRYRKDLPNGGF